MIPTKILSLIPSSPTTIACCQWSRLVVARSVSLLPASTRVGPEVRNAAFVIVNVELPDFSGFDLVEMLRPFPKGTVVLLVADRYIVEDEVRALRLGVSSYLCKPLAGSMLHECRPIPRSLAARWPSD